jgi:hypothetical protein
MVMAEDIQALLGSEGDLDNDQTRAWFWDAPGDPEYCINPWDAIPQDSCIIYTPEDVASYIQSNGEIGIPLDTRSVGSWFEIISPRETYRIEETSMDGRPVYVWDQVETEYNSGGLLTATNNPVEFFSHDGLSISAPGNPSQGTGPISAADAVIVPPAFKPLNTTGPIDITQSSSLTITFQSEGSADGVLATVVTGKDNNLAMCRFADDGSMTIPSNVLSQLDAGENAGLGLYRADFAWAPGPDGYPIRIQAFAGSVVPVNEIK